MIVVVLPGTCERRPTFATVAKPAFWTFALESGVGVGADRVIMTSVGAVVAFVCRTVAFFSVAMIALSGVAFAQVSVGEVDAVGVVVAVVRLFLAFIYGHVALVPISYVSAHTGTLVTSLGIGALGVLVTLMRPLETLVHFFEARFSVSVKAIFALTSEPTGRTAVYWWFGRANGVLVAVVVTTLAVVRFFAGSFAQGVQISSKFEVPICIALLCHLLDNCFKGVCPGTGCLVLSIIDPEAPYNTGIQGTLRPTSLFADFTKTTQFRRDSFPSSNGVMVVVRTGVGHSLEFLIGEC